jgi:hypothetical protein
MKILLLYTGHRQWRELDMIPWFMSRTQVLKESEVVYHCNNAAIDRFELKTVFRARG